MTTSFIASLAAVPMVAFAGPFFHTDANASLKADIKAQNAISASALKDSIHTCHAQRVNLQVQKNAEMKAYIKAHPFKTKADVQAFVQWRHDLQVKYKNLLKTIKDDCKKPHSSSSSSLSSSTPSSVSSTSSVSSSVSSSSAQSSTSSMTSASSQGASVQANAHGHLWFFLGKNK